MGLDKFTIEEIGSLKKNNLKDLVKNACKETAFRYLKSQIKDKDMTKLKYLKYEKLEMQEYLKCQKLSLKKKQILFKTRTRMLNVKSNFGDKSACPLCTLKEDNQSHLLECLVIKLNSPQVIENIDNCVYDDIYSTNISKLKNVANIIYEAVRTREKLLQ